MRDRQRQTETKAGGHEDRLDRQTDRQTHTHTHTHTHIHTHRDKQTDKDQGQDRKREKGDNTPIVILQQESCRVRLAS